ncbi:MAG: hypothetical protein WDZ35_13385 [Crocinitomicaceae bacterium]
MKHFIPIVLCLFYSCQYSTQATEKNILSEQVRTNDKMVCPQQHTDSIVPIVYGFPSEEMFEKEDSGLVVLGGCEVEDYCCFCMKHNIRF